MIGRVRKLKDYDILVYLNNIPYSDKISFYKYDEIKKMCLGIYAWISAVEKVI
jgi:hypothetical protein